MIILFGSTILRYIYQNNNMKPTIKAKAAISKPGMAFSIEEIEVSVQTQGEVLVRLMAAGLCHTDYDSLSWMTPLILGHEGAGIVEEVGENVQSVKPGDKVILNWGVPCGKCFQCLQSQAF